MNAEDATNYSACYDQHVATPVRMGQAIVRSYDESGNKSSSELLLHNVHGDKYSRSGNTATVLNEAKEFKQESSNGSKIFESQRDFELAASWVDLYWRYGKREVRNSHVKEWYKK